MKKPRFTTRAVGMLLLSALFLSACSDMDEYFKEPDYIAGSIYEKLEADGNHTQFLKGAEMAGYVPILNGKAILTVMAPDDQAMTSYLQQNYQTQDISTLPVAEVKKLIGFHILYYSYDKDKLVNFRPSEGDGATAEQKLVKAGLYYKFRTRSQDAVEKAKNLVVTTDAEGVSDSTYEDIFVYHPDRFLPVFSYQMFRSKGIDAAKNYTYFFPETGWTGDGAFQVANANVVDVDSKENIAKNGYIYKVDRVLRPLETIYTELKNSGKFEKFLSFYDQ
ncbi:MAG: fasciclin domain-containing protein, partial [Prevotella sp.]|nr:fasciclin domain-containing protein [Prevotella sp.]